MNDYLTLPIDIDQLATVIACAGDLFDELPDPENEGGYYEALNYSRLQRRIAEAIYAERERCARIAESFIPSGFTGDGKAGDTYAIARDDRARTIAVAIRTADSRKDKR